MCFYGDLVVGNSCDVGFILEFNVVKVCVGVMCDDIWWIKICVDLILPQYFLGFFGGEIFYKACRLEICGCINDMEDRLFIQVYDVDDYFIVEVYIGIFQVESEFLRGIIFDLAMVVEFINFFNVINFDVMASFVQ